MLEYITATEAALLLHRAERTIIGIMQKGKLKYIKVGRSYRTTKEWVNEYCLTWLNAW